MPINQAMLYYLPAHVLGVIIVGCSTLISVGGVLVMRKIIPHQKLKTHNDIAGAIFSTLGVVYAVLLAFVVIVVWEDFNRDELNVEEESNCIMDLRADAYAFEPQARSDIHALTAEYVKLVINDEWPRLARGEPSGEAVRALKDLFAAYVSYEPRSEKEKVFFEKSVGKLNRLIELRRSRVLDSRKGLHPVMWFVLITGAVATISFASFFGSEHLRPQIVMTALLALVISLILFLAMVFDFPFTGDVRISPDPFKGVLKAAEAGAWQKK